MPRSLPTNPSVRFLQKEAKDLIKSHKDGDVTCCATLRYHYRFSRAEDDEILKAKISLQEAQHALALDYGYRNWTDLTNRAAALGKVNTPQADAASIEGKPDAGDQQTIEFVGHVLSESVKARASDIHIEPHRGKLRIRYRVDGILRDLDSLPESVEPTIIARIKVMAEMDTSEVRLPQDSRFHIKIGEQEVDVRVSTIPTAVGERVVLRLISKSIAPLKFSDLGLLPEQQERLKGMLSSHTGIILVTGPAGCGKTTTLHAMLASVNTPSINALTIEDPVEYLIDGVSQIQVDPKIDLTFANGLRSIERQDPDVILIGEIRDRETAVIAVQAALTGHLVLSALHTNDSATTLTRLVNLGVEPSLLSSAVIAVVAQRLVRLLCGNCKVPFTPDDSALKSLSIAREQLKKDTLYRADECGECSNTGYRGRIGLFEIMAMDDALRSTILQTQDAKQINSQARAQGMTTLRQDGIQKVINGDTTIEEMLRVTQI